MANLAAEVTLEWADGEYLFALKGKQIEELEKLCDEGIGSICLRVFAGNYSWKMLYDTIRLGLIGGGMDAVNAGRLCKTYVDGAPIDTHRTVDGKRIADPMSTLAVARSILNAVHFGWEGLPEAPKSGEADGPERKPTGVSTGPHS